MMKKVLIADDHGLYRGGLAVLIRDSLGVDDVVETGSLDDALAELSDAAIDTVVLDLNMPGMDGVSSLAEIKRRRPDIRMVVLSASDNRDDVLGALANGAQGYIWKGDDDDEIASGLKTISRGAIYAPAFLASGGSEPASYSGTDDEPVGVDVTSFTPRQRDVFRLLGEGKSNKEIARDLDLAESTVKIHLAAVYRTLGARNRTHAVVLAQKLTEEKC